jgi:hypothetical protein
LGILVEGRTRIALGGFFAGAATVSVVAALVVTNASALADTSGTPVEADPVVVPFATATPHAPAPAATAEAAPLPTPVATAAPTPSATAETVPAPAPRDVAKEIAGTSPTQIASDDHDDRQKAPADVAPKPAEKTSSDRAESAGQADAWQKAIAWAHARGWSDERIERWLSRGHDNQKMKLSEIDRRSFDRRSKTRSQDGTPDRRD